MKITIKIEIHSKKNIACKLCKIVGYIILHYLLQKFNI